MLTAKNKKAFTLIELLIVIVIIGILASALIPRLQRTQERAKKTHAQNDLKTMSTLIYLAELNTDLLLKDITHNISSENPCRSVVNGGAGIPLMNMKDSNTNEINCRANREQAITIIGTVAGESSVTQRYQDPRGSPYLLDENEGELSASDCRFDSLQSAGPDGYRIYDNNLSGDQSMALSHPLNKDNVLAQLRPVKCKGAY